MEIKATGKLTLDAIGTLLHATMFRGKSPKREIVKISAVIALLIAFSLVWLLLFENAEFFAYMLAVAVMIILMLCLYTGGLFFRESDIKLSET